MQKFSLCKDCLARFGKNPSVALSSDGKQCRICLGSLSAIPGMVKEALAQASSFEWSTFSVSSSFKKSVLAREDEVSDCFLPGSFTSIKNTVNFLLANEIASASGKKNDQRAGEAVFSFDFTSGKPSVSPSPLFISGHYLKFSRQHCQSRWHCSDCGGKGCPTCRGSGMNYPSIEDELCKAIGGEFGAQKCTLHASGREDVDVRCLGTGRPFVLELRSPSRRSADLEKIEKRLSSNEAVRAKGLQVVGKHFLDAVCNSHFEKEYSALVSADRPLTPEDARKAESLSGKTLFQQTPQRVLARRTDMERRRKIFRLSATQEGRGKLRLQILAEAGTYIKELISSDEGRTTPSVSGLLGCKAACEELDVISIHDYFLRTIKK